jgi:hypothetical protein
MVVVWNGSQMKRLLPIILLVTLLIPSRGQSQSGLSPDDIDRISRAVVQIVAIEDDDVLGTGSGTIVSANGLIYTNRHVIHGADEFAILILDDPNEPAELAYFADIVSVYTQLDVAVLQITRDKRGRTIDPEDLDLDFVEPVASDATRGELVYIFGFPGIGEGYLVLTQGNITTIRNGEIGGNTMAVLYQTDAEISPGNSGGLVVNVGGGIVGIPTSVVTEQETGGRLGGVLPFGAVLALEEAEAESGRSLADAAAANPGSDGSSTTPDTVPENTTRDGFAESISVTCPNDVEVINGVPITVRRMQPGSVYTATVLGMGGFDPVIGVLGPDGNVSTCSDDEAAADDYAVNLPSTGPVNGGERDSQVAFTHNSPRPADVTLVVGGYDGASGHFVVIIEGMDVSPTDLDGDQIQVSVTRAMADSEAFLTVYMVAQDNELDPLMVMRNEFDIDIYDVDDELLHCDDAGNDDRCWGFSESLRPYEITLAGTEYSGHTTDALISIDPFGAADSGFPFLTYVLRSYESETEGDYIIVIHTGL